MREVFETNVRNRRKRRAFPNVFWGTLCFCCLLWTLLFLHPTGLPAKSVMKADYSEELQDGEQTIDGAATVSEEDQIIETENTGPELYNI